MVDVRFFDTVEELTELTGLNDRELWNNGFCLDDWDWGFETDKNYGYDTKDEHGLDTYEWDWLEVPSYVDRILFMMRDYCVGFEHTEYNGKHYFLQYHA